MTRYSTQVEAKKQEMQARRAQAVAEEFETMRAIARKEREVAKKLEAVRIETEARIAKEAAIRDAERKKKVEEKLKKSQAILKEIERKGEESRLKAIEKEKRIQAILEARSRVSTVPSRHRRGPNRFLEGPETARTPPPHAGG